MLDVGWSELVLIGVVALIFVGPKDLPRMFNALGRFTAKARGMAREFQRAMDDAAKSSGLDDVRKDLNGLKTGLNAATNPAGFGINALEDAARKFEKWDPKTVLKPAAAADATTAAPVVTVGGTEIGPETKALADKRASEAAAARAKAHELQAKAAQSASATFAARAKADAEAAALKVAEESASAPAPDLAAKPAAKPRASRAKTAETAVVAAEAEKPARKPPVRRKKSDA